MADRVGQQLGNYRLIRLLGKGGFAEVYLGEHVYLQTPAAIKLLQTKVANREDLEGFLKEAQTIAQLVHPHIVRVLEFGLDRETPYLVMDYAPAGTLRQRHPRGTQLPLTTIISYVKPIAEALQYAHEEKFIHRDVKPENMLVGRRDAILLSDFGIALIAQSSLYQSTQEVIGTVAYMSPEQIQGKPRPASDQYSLSIVVYEWLSGDRPFHGSFTELCTQHMFASPPPLHEKIPALSSAVEQVVMTALSKDPKQRFVTVQAFAAALEQTSQVEAEQTITASHSPQPTNALTEQSPSKQPTELASSPIEALIPTKLITPASQSFAPTETVTPPNQALPLPTQLAASESPTPFPTEVALPSKQSTLPPDMMLPLKPPKRGISRGWLILLVGLIAAVALVSAISVYTYVNTNAHNTTAYNQTTTNPGATSTEQVVNPAYPPVNGIYCDSLEQTAYHIHAHLTIYIDGKQVSVPQGVGIASDQSCLYWLHTHDSSGVIHIEAPKKVSPTLGNFLDIWGQSFNSLGFQNELASSAGWTIYVDGKKVNESFNQLVLQPHQVITIAYNSPNITPDTSFNWPAGE